MCLLGWFREDGDSVDSLSLPTLSSLPSLSITPTRYLRLYQQFRSTRPKPLKLRIIHLDDRHLAMTREAIQERQMLQVDEEEIRRTYGIENLIRPEGKAYSSMGNRNVHVILAMQDTTYQHQQQQQSQSSNDLTTPLLQAQSPDPTSSASSFSSPTSSPLSYPPSFLLTDFKIISPSHGYTSPLTSGFMFFTESLPTPEEIRAWDDWSEEQWRKRMNEMKHQPQRRIEHERIYGIEKGELKEESNEEEEDADEPMFHRRPRQPAPVGTYPVTFATPPPPPPPSSSSSRILCPLVGFFRLNESGIALESSPIPMRDDSNAHNTAHSSLPSHSTTNDMDDIHDASATSSFSPAHSPSDASISSDRHGQTAYSYRHHFVRPVYGRFITLIFLRATHHPSPGDPPTTENQQATNIDVAYFGVKGYRRGMRPDAVRNAPPPTIENETTIPMSDDSSTEPEANSLSPSPSPLHDATPSASDDPDDGFDFDAPLPSTTTDVAARIRAYLDSLQRVGIGMANEVANMDAHLARVQAVLAIQQRAQQQQQQLRLRMLLLQTQQLQLQLQNQQLSTRATLANAQLLHDRTANFVSQRRALLDQVEEERQRHRQRLAELNEEKQREESLLENLRTRVQQAKEREDYLRQRLAHNQAERERIEEERRRRGVFTHQTMSSSDTSRIRSDESQLGGDASRSMLVSDSNASLPSFDSSSHDRTTRNAADDGNDSHYPSVGEHNHSLPIGPSSSSAYSTLIPNELPSSTLQSTIQPYHRLLSPTVPYTCSIVPASITSPSLPLSSSPLSSSSSSFSSARFSSSSSSSSSSETLSRVRSSLATASALSNRTNELIRQIQHRRNEQERFSSTLRQTRTETETETDCTTDYTSNETND